MSRRNKKKKALPVQPVQRRRTWFIPTLALIAVVTIFALALVFGRTNKERAVPKIRVATTQVAPKPTKLGWEIADYLLERRGQYERDIGSDGLPEWNLFTEQYFRTLKSRRDGVIAWAGQQKQKPAIAFLGQIHVKVAGGNTPESIREIDKIQTRIFENVKKESTDAQVIVIEESGCGDNEVLTKEAFARITRGTFWDLYKVRVTDVMIHEMMTKDPQAATRSIMELPTPVTCGEEWPNRMETRLIQRPSSTEVQAMATRDLINSFNILRSEIILIRALEFLRAKQGSKAVLIQGVAHQPEIQKVAPEYHIALTARVPE